MMSMLVAAIRGKTKAKSDTGYVLRSQYPPYVLYDVCPFPFIFLLVYCLICFFLD